MWFDNLLEMTADSWGTVKEHLPQLVGAALLMLIGWGLGRLLGRWVTVADRSLARLTRTAVVGDAVETSGAPGFAPVLIGRLVFWIVLIGFSTAAMEVIGMPIMTDLLGRIVTYLPNLVGAMLIISAGMIGAQIVRASVKTAAETAGIARSRVLAGASHAVVLVIASVIALEQLGVNGRILGLALIVIIGSAFAAAGLAFGLGARALTSNLIAARYASDLLRVGQVIRIEGVHGTVVALTSTAVIVDAQDERVVIPAARFQEANTSLISKEG